MDSIERYKLARDREQHAFEVSALGERARHAINYTSKYADPVAWVADELRLALAAEYAFGRRWPAFYAGRALRLW